MLGICSWIVLALLCAFPLRAAEIAGPVHVIDGDTIDVGKTRIRLHGIDALERGQTCLTLSGQNWGCGDWTTQKVRERYQGSHARCEALTRDKYDRVVARCFVGGADMGRVLVRAGLAYAFVKYARAYVADEDHAAKAALGIHGFIAQSPARYRLTRGRPEQTSAANGCRIKGNIARKGTLIYHMPGQAFYTQTWITPARGERWFCTEAQARASGWRRSKR